MVEIVKDENKFAQTKLRKMLNNEELLAYKVEGYSGTSNYLIVDEERCCFVVYHFTFERVELGEDNKKSTVFSECYVLDTIPFEGMQEVSIDKFATVAHFTFNEGTVLKLSSLSDNILSFTNRLENLGMKTVKLERKWYNKVYGFRSKKKWKMAIASVVYLMLFFGVVGMFSGEDEPDVVDATEETEQVNDEEAERVEAEKQKKLEEEKLAKKEKEEQEAEKKAEEERLAAEEQEKKEKEEADALAKKEADKFQHEVVDGVHVFTSYNPISLSTNVFMSSFSIEATKIMKERHEEFTNGVVFRNATDMRDNYGNEEKNIVVSVWYSQETLQKINYENWPYLVGEDLYNTADSTLIHFSIGSNTDVRNNPNENAPTTLHRDSIGAVYKE